MIEAQIIMKIHNACYLSDLKCGHFIFNDKLYVKSRVIDNDMQYKQDIYVCIDEDGHYHSRGKNLTLAREMRSAVCAEEIDVDSELGDISRIAVMPATFEWKSE